MEQGKKYMEDEMPSKMSQDDCSLDNAVSEHSVTSQSNISVTEDELLKKESLICKEVEEFVKSVEESAISQVVMSLKSEEAIKNEKNISAKDKPDKENENTVSEEDNSGKNGFDKLEASDLKITRGSSNDQIELILSRTKECLSKIEVDLMEFSPKNSGSSQDAASAKCPGGDTPGLIHSSQQIRNPSSNLVVHDFSLVCDQDENEKHLSVDPSSTASLIEFSPMKNNNAVSDMIEFSPIKKDIETLDITVPAYDEPLKKDDGNDEASMNSKEILTKPIVENIEAKEVENTFAENMPIQKPDGKWPQEINEIKETKPIDSEEKGFESDDLEKIQDSFDEMNRSNAEFDDSLENEMIAKDSVPTMEDAISADSGDILRNENSFVDLDTCAKPDKEQKEANVTDTEIPEKIVKITKNSEVFNAPTSCAMFSSSGCWFKLEQLNPKVEALIYWRDPKQSGGVFGTGLVILLALAYFSVISVLANLGLALLACTIAFRLYKDLLQAVQKTPQIHPFHEFLDFDLNFPEDKVHHVADIAAKHFNACVGEMRRLFLVVDLIDSIKFALVLWVLSYVGAWFNGLTLVIIVFVALFTLPKVYENNKAVIDNYLALAKSQIAEAMNKVQDMLPAGLKKKFQEKKSE